MVNEDYLKLCREMVARAKWWARSRHLTRDGMDYVCPNNWHTLARGTGWHVLGQGHYAVAMEHKDHKGQVLKMSGRAGYGDGPSAEYKAPGEKRARLDAWPVFARHCQAHPHKNLPKILHFEQVSKGRSWAVLPRYVEGTKVSSRKFSADRHRIVSAFDNASPAEQWMWPILNMQDALGFTVDLHGGNTMYDPVTGECIVTDPFSTCQRNADDMITKLTTEGADVCTLIQTSSPHPRRATSLRTAVIRAIPSKWINDALKELTALAVHDVPPEARPVAALERACNGDDVFGSGIRAARRYGKVQHTVRIWPGPRNRLEPWFAFPNQDRVPIRHREEDRFVLSG